MSLIPQPIYNWTNESARERYDEAVRLAQDIMREAQERAGEVMKNATRIRDAYTTVSYTVVDIGRHEELRATAPHIDAKDGFKRVEDPRDVRATQRAILDIHEGRGQIK